MWVTCACYDVVQMDATCLLDPFGEFRKSEFLPVWTLNTCQQLGVNILGHLLFKSSQLKLHIDDWKSLLVVPASQLSGRPICKPFLKATN